MKALAITLLMFSAPAWAAARTHVLIVSGIGGEPVYSERFRQWSVRMVDVAQSRLEIPADRSWQHPWRRSVAQRARSRHQRYGARHHAPTLSRTTPGNH